MSSSRPSLKRFAMFAALLLAITGIVGAVATAANPDSGTLSLEERQLTWTGEATGGTLAYPEPRPECDLAVTSDCDEYKLSVDIDKAHWDSNAGGAEVLIAWENEENDFDLYVYDSSNQLVGESATSGGTSERVFIPSASRDDGEYRVLVSPFNTEDDPSYGGGVRLESRASVGNGTTGGEVPDEPLSDVKCVDGMAGPFPCDEVDLESYVPVSGLGGSRPLPDGVEPTIADLANDSLNDIWGWTDPLTKREYALVGKTDGTAFVDITDPKKPVYRGQLVSAQSLAELAPVETIFKTWRDLKVYKNHVYIGSEEPNHGMQVFDLTKLRGDQPAGGWKSDAQYDGFGNSHNIAINEESGFLYAIGTNTCEGGPHIVDIRDPKKPVEAGCVSEDGYTHDTQCVNYDGPDRSFAGREICFSSNEDTVTIVDVTDKSAPKQLARIGYKGAAYTHQGWLTKDGKRFLMNDELDEQGQGTGTTTRVFNVEKLNAPSLVGEYVAKVGSIDHNLYTKGDTVYEANYRSGLRVLDARKADEGSLSEVGFFDVYPADDEAEFNGAWSNYPYFPSGTVIVSGIEQGLFVLRPKAAAGGVNGTFEAPSTPTAAAEAPSTSPAPVQQTSCSVSRGFKTVGIQAFGRRGLELEFQREVDGKVGVDVFQQSVGRRIVGERLVARFSGKSDDVRWDGKANRPGRKITDGYYFVRYRVPTAQGVDTRRIAMRRVGGKWSKRPEFYRRSSCDLIRSFKIERPVFGGRSNRALTASYQASAAARATVTVMRGSTVVKRFAARSVAARRTIRVRLDSGKLRRGTYRVRLSLTERGKRAVVSTLSTQRL